MVLDKLCEWEYTPVFPYASRVLGGKRCGHVKSLIIEHLNQLAEQPMETWIRNPFEASLPVPQLSFQEKELLIDLSSDGALQLQFKPRQ